MNISLTIPRTHAPVVSPPYAPHFRGAWLVAGIILFLLGSLGCNGERIDIDYGQSGGLSGKKSVNGLGALRAIYADSGYRCYSATALTKSTNRMQVIVWAPDSTDFPSISTMDYFERWLASKDNRTLVFIGRDFDAAVDYWDQMIDKVPEDQQDEARKLQSLARAENDAMRVKMPDEYFCRWFSFQRDDEYKRVVDFEGDWAPKSGDKESSRIFVQGEFSMPYRNTSITVPDEFLREKGYDEYSSKIPTATARTQWANEYMDQEWNKRPKFESLLASSDGKPLIVRLTKSEWKNSQIILFANGSMLLNEPLVNHLNRSIANKLVEATGPPASVAFLATSTGSPRIRNQDDSELNRKGLEFLTVWPLNLIMMHASLAGIIVCFAFMPIFGRGKKLRPRAVSDFGQHVEALGQMLARTGNRDFALRQIADYFRITRKEPSNPWATFQGAESESVTKVGEPPKEQKSATPNAGENPSESEDQAEPANPYADPSELNSAPEVKDTSSPSQPASPPLPPPKP